MAIPSLFAHWLTRHQLPEAYLHHADQWFRPLAHRLAEQQRSIARTLVVGINGSQGSGKSTLADYLRLVLAETFTLSVTTLSLDDVYLSRDDRTALARTVHPLLITRGVPGTHDLELAHQTIQQLSGPEATEVSVPRFDKALDDRVAVRDWPRVKAPVDVLILEGWCLGVEAETEPALTRSINALERDEDPDQIWRRYVNQAISTQYLTLYRRIDEWVMLQAPSFESVFTWRQEQEQKLAATQQPGRSAALMNPHELRRFIAHYERLTKHALETLPGRVQHCFKLGSERQIVDYRTQTPSFPPGWSDGKIPPPTRPPA